METWIQLIVLLINRYFLFNAIIDLMRDRFCLNCPIKSKNFIRIDVIMKNLYQEKFMNK